PVILGGEPVEGEVAADGGEGLGVLGQTLLLELLAGELPAGSVSLGAVDAAQPALVFPRGGAPVDALLGEGAESGAQPLRLGGPVVLGIEEGQRHRSSASRPCPRSLATNVLAPQAWPSSGTGASGCRVPSGVRVPIRASSLVRRPGHPPDAGARRR